MTADRNLFPASFAQRRLWFIQQMAPQSSAYNMLTTTPVPPGFSASMIQLAVTALSQHHENLRTCFEVDSEQLQQCVFKTGSIELELQQVNDMSQVSAISGQCVARAFDLSKAPLARFQLFQFSDGRQMLALIMHHIISDARTLEITLENLSTVLHSLRAGLPPALPESPIEYADYSVWQLRRLSGARLENLTSYWTTRLSGTEELRLPYDRERCGVFSSRGGVVPFELDHETALNLRSLAASLKSTLFTVLLGALSIVLNRYSGQSRFVIGIPVDGRSRSEFERVAGLFVNSIAFGVEVSEDLTLEAHLQNIARSLASDLSNQEMPFDLLVDALQIKRQADRNPLFQVMLQVQVGAEGPQSGETNPQLDTNNLSSQLDLSLILFDQGQGSISGGAIYATELFDECTMRSLVGGFQLILGTAAKSLTKPLHALQVQDAGTLKNLLALGEGKTKRDRHRDLREESMAGWFATVAAEHAGKVAIVVGAHQVTYQELVQRSTGLTDRLQGYGIGSGSVVAICLPRSIEFTVAILAVIQAGATYVVLSPELPKSRKAFILQDCQAALAISLTSEAGGFSGFPVLDLDSNELSRVPKQTVNRQFEHASYLIYTSGTSGNPKGIAIGESALLNHMSWIISEFAFSPDDRFLQRTPLSFDASVWEFWAPLLVGASMVLPPDSKGFDAQALLSDLKQHRITVLQLVPCLLRTLLSATPELTDLHLRLLFCGGEKLNSDVCHLAQRSLDSEIVNLYGPSETTIDATFHRCDREPVEADIPIGKPIANVNAKVLDSLRRPVPQGVIGELYIGGAAVGLGYINLQELTAERFVDDPFIPGGRLFRTGDLARFGRTGELHYCGRIDEQVKLRGNRIELQEIDAVVQRHISVRHAASVVQQQGSDRERLVSFVKLTDGASSDASGEILAWLRSQLPVYAVPSCVAAIEQIPLTVHGKTDRNALKSIDVLPVPLKPTEPVTELQKSICSVFSDALQVSAVGIDDDFFDLGGNSLLVVPVSTALATALQIRISVVDIFEFPCARLLAQKASERLASAGDIDTPVLEGTTS